MERVFTLALVQSRCAPDRETNLRRALDRIAEAAEAGAQLVCLPEIFLSQYFCQEENPDWFDHAEPIPGPATAALAEAARKHRAAVIVPLFEKRAAGLYHNSLAVISRSGELLGVYRKMHIPDDPLYYEKFYFTPGDLGFRTFAIDGAQAGPLICWDQWYPEAARLTALRGADFLVYPSAIGWHPAEKAGEGERQYAAWQTMHRAHAISNGVFVAAVNRVGHEKPLEDSPNRPADYQGIEFWGGSFVCDPFGQVLRQAGHGDEELLVVRCDLSLIEQTRRHWPFLRDRRIDAYEGITRRFLDSRE